MPSVSHSFGLFDGERLIGVVTFGLPASPSLCNGIAGKENAHNVLELNRLVLLPECSGNNNASFLVSHALRMLPNHTFVVSYADTAWSHVGYVYQATNFLYTGMSANRTDVYKPGGGHTRHTENLDKTKRQTRSAKHRYVYLVGTKRQKREMIRELRYPVLSRYPKGDETRYDTDNPKVIIPTVVYDKHTNK